MAEKRTKEDKIKSVSFNSSWFFCRNQNFNKNAQQDESIMRQFIHNLL